MRSVILKNIFRYAFRGWDKIPNDELKGYSIYIFLVGLLIGCLLFGLMKVLFKWSFNELIMILLANSVFSFLFSMVIYKREWIDEKYGLGYDGYYIVPGRNEGMSYKAAIVLITTAAPLFSILFFVMGLHYGNIIVATAFLIAMPIPFILMFLRIDAYENKIIVTPKQLDYCPPFYFMLGQLNAMAGLEFSIRTILISLIYGTYPLIWAVLYFLFSFLTQIFIASPDILDNVVPFDLRTVQGYKKGSVIYLVLIFIGYGIFLVFEGVI